MTATRPGHRPCGGPCGFTLVELIAIILVLAILAGVAIPRYVDVADRARRSVAMAELTTISRTLINYEIDTGRITDLSAQEIDVANLAGVAALRDAFSSPVFVTPYPFGARTWSWYRSASSGGITFYDPTTIRPADVPTLEARFNRPGRPGIDWDDDGAGNLARLSYYWYYQ